MANLRWLKGEIKELFLGEWKSLYETERGDLLVKKLPSYDILKKQKARQEDFRKNIKENLPETSFFKACDDGGNCCSWIVQEKIDGRWLYTILNPNEKMFRQAWGQYNDIKSKCPGIEDDYLNFVWDDYRNRLFYVGT